MGNVTAAVVKRNVVGGARSVIVDITFSNAYATNGDTATAAVIAQILPDVSNGLSGVLFCKYQNDASGKFAVLDAANKKFKLFTVAGVEATNATDQSAVVIRVRMNYGQVNG